MERAGRWLADECPPGPELVYECPPGPELVYISARDEDDPTLCYVCGEPIKWLDYAAMLPTADGERYRHVDGPCRAAQLRHEIPNG